MRLARIEIGDDVVVGAYEDGVVESDGEQYVVGEDGDLAPPCDPSAVYCIGRNYAETLAQKGYERAEQPTFFIKPPASVIPHEAPIPYPTFSEEVTYAGELVAVIDERCHDLTPEEANTRARRESETALAALDEASVVDGTARDYLADLAEFVVVRER